MGTCRTRTTDETLRQRAERRLNLTRAEISKLSTEDVQSLVYELQVHQIELEVQNEELRRIQSELTESRNRFSDLYEFAPVGYLTLDVEGVIRKANLTAAAMLQIDRGRLIGRNLHKLLDQKNAERLHHHLLQALAMSGKQNCGVQVHRPDGSTIDIQIETLEIHENGEPLCCLALSDITRTEDRVRRCERLASLGTLAAGIAHEINNPLWMIDLQSEVALSAEGKPDREQKMAACLHEIKALVKRGGKIVESVLRFAKQDATPKWNYSLNDVLHSARDYTRAKAEKRRVTITLELSDELPEIAINPTEMEQVFVNLLANAIDACAQGGNVQVVSGHNASFVSVRVQDSGCGMSKEDLDSIFDPFFTKRRKSGHTGLGLSVVHGIIEDHEGKIDVHSELGQGATFTVSLPVTPRSNEGGHSGDSYLGCR
jgi:two-component system cell cycle sensor histidine kinase/response regulator CckA